MNVLRSQAAICPHPWVLLEGRSTVEAALAGWWEVSGVMIDHEHPWEVPIWSGLEVMRVPRVEMETMGDPGRHAGVLGLAKVPAEIREVAAFARSLESDALLVICPGLSDPVLAGTMARHAEEVGAAAVLFGAEGVSPLCPAAVAASDGAVFRLPVRVADGGQLLRSLKAAAVHLTGWEDDAAPLSGNLPVKGRRALVIGNPGLGLGPFWRAVCDRRGSGDPQAILRGMAPEVG